MPRKYCGRSYKLPIIAFISLGIPLSPVSFALNISGHVKNCSRNFVRFPLSLSRLLTIPYYVAWKPSLVPSILSPIGRVTGVAPDFHELPSVIHTRAISLEKCVAQPAEARVFFDPRVKLPHYVCLLLSDRKAQVLTGHGMIRVSHFMGNIVVLKKCGSIDV